MLTTNRSGLVNIDKDAVFLMGIRALYTTFYFSQILYNKLVKDGQKSY